MSIFYLIIVGVVVCYIFIGWRLIAPARLRRPWREMAWGGLVLLPLLLPATYFLRFRWGQELLGDLAGWIAYVGLGFFSLVFAMLLVRDGAGLVVRAAGRITHRGGSSPDVRRSDDPGGTEHPVGPRPAPAGDATSRAPENPPDPGRREFLVRSMNTGILCASALLTGFGIHEARKGPQVVEVRVPIPGLPPGLEGFRIVQISDIHVGPTIKRDYVAAAVEMAGGLGADLIAFTGDLADGPVEALREDVAPLADLSAPHGAYFVTGNHEYYSGAEAWIEAIGRLGFTVLTNDHRLIEVGPARLLLAGVPDYHAGRYIPSQASSPRAALRDAPPADVRVLLAHQPRSVYAAVEAGCDLQISGHTHGGQYFYGDVLVALSQPFLKGLHHYRGMPIYINSGTGYWGPPLRLGAPAEITALTLTGSGTIAGSR